MNATDCNSLQQVSSDIGPEILAALAEGDVEVRQALIQSEDVPVNPKTVARLTLLLRVTKWMVDNGSANLTEACEQTGVKRWSLYRWLEDPEVMRHYRSRVRLLLVLEQQTIEANWLEVILAQFEVAKDKGDKRASTAAARFLASRLDKSTAQITEQRQQGTERKSRARTLLDDLLETGSRVKLTAEVERPDVIDVRP